MTLSADSDTDDHKSEIGTALAISGSGITGLDPFMSTIDEAPSGPRPWHARLLDYSAHAAMIVGLIGFAWTVSDHVVKRDPATPVDNATKAAALVPVVAPAVAPRAEEINDLRRVNRQMAAEIKVLHASIENLRGTVTKEHAADQIRALSASVEDMKNGLNTAKNETSAQIAQLSGKLEKLQPAAKAPPPTIAHAGKLDTTATASIPLQPEVVKAIPVPSTKPINLATPDETSGKDAAGKEMAGKEAVGAKDVVGSKDVAPAKPQVIAGWVVRDVYQGVALIEGKRGSMEIVPGVSVPGAGVVKSIERHGSGWTVTTTKGLLAYAAPPRDYRRGQGRDFYPDYRYDF